MTISITRSGDRLVTATPYHPDYVSRAKELGGRWDPATRVWAFHPRAERHVRELLTEVYGTDGSAPVDTVDVRVTFPEGARGDREPVRFGSRVVARAFGRDSGARLGDDVLLVSGSISSGGSRQYWTTELSEGAVVELYEVSAHDVETMQREHPSWIIEVIT